MDSNEEMKEFSLNSEGTRQDSESLTSYKETTEYKGPSPDGLYDEKVNHHKELIKKDHDGEEISKIISQTTEKFLRDTSGRLKLSSRESEYNKYQKGNHLCIQRHISFQGKRHSVSHAIASMWTDKNAGVEIKVTVLYANTGHLESLRVEEIDHINFKYLSNVAWSAVSDGPWEQFSDEAKKAYLSKKLQWALQGDEGAELPHSLPRGRAETFQSDLNN